MVDTIKITSTLTFEEYWRVYYRRSAIVSYFVFLLLLYMAIVPGISGPEGEMWFIYLASSIVFAVIWWLAIVRRKEGAKDSFKCDPLVSGERIYVFNEKGVQIKTAVSDSFYSWKAIYRVKESKTDFLIYIGPVGAHCLPKRSFSAVASVNEFKVLLQKLVPKWCEFLKS